MCCVVDHRTNTHLPERLQTIYERHHNIQPSVPQDQNQDQSTQIAPLVPVLLAKKIRLVANEAKLY